MKLYYMPGACSMASHIVFNELDLPVELAKVQRDPRRTEDGEDYYSVNPDGYVPALRLDNGEVLLENAAILPYIADLKPEAGWAPREGQQRYGFLQWLGFLNSEIHGGYRPLFSGADDAAKDAAIKKLKQRYRKVEDALAKSDFLMGDRPTVVDAYLFVVTNWAGRVKLELGEFPKLAAFMDRMRARPAVQKTLREEGLAA